MHNSYYIGGTSRETKMEVTFDVNFDQTLRRYIKIARSFCKPLAISIVSTSLFASPASARGVNGAALGLGLMGAVVGLAIAQQAYAHHGVRRHRVERAYYVPRRMARRRAGLATREISVRPDHETVIQSYYNCSGPVMVKATAAHGFIKQRWSSRFNCGNPDQPAIEFFYLNPPFGFNDDFVTYSERGRAVSIDHITFSSLTPVDNVEQPVSIANTEEKWVYRTWNCNNGPHPLFASARSGYTVIRDNVANVCGEQGHPVKEAIYRSAEGFVGSDSVTIKTNSKAPFEIPIVVSSAVKSQDFVPAGGAFKNTAPWGPPPAAAPQFVSSEYVGPTALPASSAPATSSQYVPPSSTDVDAQASLCHSDWSKCKDNDELANNYSPWMRAKLACKSEANTQVRYGSPEWPWLPFGTFRGGEDYVTSGIAILIEPDAQFQNGFGAMVHSRVECTYDLRAKRVINVDISER